MKAVKTISYQQRLVNPLPDIFNNKEYTIYRKTLNRIDEIITQSGADLEFAEEYLEMKQQESSKKFSGKREKRIIEEGVIAFRCNLVKIMTGYSFRDLSIHLADSLLLQKFCRLRVLDSTIAPPSKSTLDRWSKCFSKEQVDSTILCLLKSATGSDNPLELKDKLNFEDIFVDSTCIKAGIHFPVDWILPKDCAYTILQAILVIRKHGLRHRISHPKQIMSDLNALCMSMSSSTKKRGNSKTTKKVFRQLKNLVNNVKEHGERYAVLLVERGLKETDLSKKEISYILSRLNKMIALIPLAIKQASSRILKGEYYKNKDKILSAYHSDINVIKRGKAGGIVEFGNTLFIAEQSDGLIVDWALYRRDIKDPQATNESIKRMTEEFEYEIKTCTGDRGCQSKRNDQLLKKKGIYSGLCPRNPHEYNEKLKDGKFKKLQKRRSQTEGRIGILKNTILNGSLYEREFEGKDLKISWAILFHNLWVLARLPKVETQIEQVAA